MPKSLAVGWVRVVLFASLLLSIARKLAARALRGGLRLLEARLFGGDPRARVLPLRAPSWSIRYLSQLGRLRRQEGRVAWDLGSLAKAVRRQGLQDRARRLAKGAFDRWRRARNLERRLGRQVNGAPDEHAL